MATEGNSEVIIPADQLDETIVQLLASDSNMQYWIDPGDGSEGHYVTFASSDSNAETLMEDQVTYIQIVKEGVTSTYTEPTEPPEEGMTLYYFEPETVQTEECNGVEVGNINEEIIVKSEPLDENTKKAVSLQDIEVVNYFSESMETDSSVQETLGTSNSVQENVVKRECIQKNMDKNNSYLDHVQCPEVGVKKIPYIMEHTKNVPFSSLRFFCFCEVCCSRENSSEKHLTNDLKLKIRDGSELANSQVGEGSVKSSLTVDMENTENICDNFDLCDICGDVFEELFHHLKVVHNIELRDPSEIVVNKKVEDHDCSSSVNMAEQDSQGRPDSSDHQIETSKLQTEISKHQTDSSEHQTDNVRASDSENKPFKVTKSKCDQSGVAISGESKSDLKPSPSHKYRHLQECYVKLEKLLECSFCRLILPSFPELQEHLEKVHKNLDRKKIIKAVKPCVSGDESASDCYICSECGKRNNSYKSLSAHKLRAHKLLKENQCSRCKEDLLSPESLLQHQLENKCCSCPKCGKQFLSKDRVNSHVKYVHTDERNFKCLQCPATYKTARHLRTHIRTHTGERPYVCKLCRAAFNVAGTLKKHMKTHTGEYSFICEHCGSKFIDRSALLRHKRVHTGEKPYQCHMCPSAHATQSALKIHIRTHTGEKPYICCECGAGFIAYSCLKTHMKNHHGQDLKIEKYEVKLYQS